MTHYSLSDPISRKFQWKYASLTLNFLYVRNKYSPDPEFCIFLGLGTNFVCYRYKRHLKNALFYRKTPDFFSWQVYFSLYAQKYLNSNNCSWVLRRRDDYPRHWLRFMSRLAYGLECLYCGEVNPTKKMIDPQKFSVTCRDGFFSSVFNLV